MSSNTSSWLTLLRSSGIGPVSALRMIEAAGNVENALGMSALDLEALGIDGALTQQLRTPDTQSIERDLKWLDHPNHHMVTHQSKHYPCLLRKISDPPLVLFVAGTVEILAHPQIAVVGSRNPTAQGRENAAAFAHFLASAGFAITSGLARGVDAAAHQGALKATGLTVAVCGTGLDDVYPRQNRDLATDIAKSGAVISEFGTQTAPHKFNFPRRNRIISGLSVGTLVVEAAQRSGSLITARLASEQGREIFAVPGSIHNPMTRGCHRLIREGARLVESGGDIIEKLGNLTRTTLNDNSINVASSLQGDPELDPDYDKLMQCLGFEPSTVDQLCQRSGLTADAVSSMLLILELRGYVATTDGGRYERSI